MSEMAKKMFGKSPKLERNEEGDMAVKEGKEEKAEGENEEGSNEGVPVEARHALERMDLHHKHQKEHHVHDHGEHGDKKELHARHREEHHALHKKHEKELSGKKE